MDKNQNHPSTNYWETQERRQLVNYLVGEDYGPEPLAKLNDVRRTKEYVAEKIFEQVNGKATSVALEIGSGWGYLTGYMAARCKRVIACDISRSFLNEAKETCESFSNIDFHWHQPGDLNFVESSTVDFAFAYNVFIHLNFYEIVNYLEQVSRLLKPNGHFWFDIQDLDRLHIRENQEFMAAEKVLRHNPHEKRNLFANSAQAIVRAAHVLGFNYYSQVLGQRDITHLLLSKSEDQIQPPGQYPTA